MIYLGAVLSLKTVLIGLAVVGVAALGIGLTAFGDTEIVRPHIEAKPDPDDTPHRERPGFIRANEDCESGLGDAFTEGDLGLATSVVLTGLDSPTTLEFYDEDTAFVGERAGQVVLWDLGTGEAEPVIDLTSETGTKSDQGLVGLAVTPDRNHLLIHYTTQDRESKIVAQPLEDGVPTVTGRIDVLTVEQPSEQHNGGTIAFDGEGNLWASFGDGGGQGDRWQNAQDPMTPLGSMLRMRIDLDDLTLSGAPGNAYADPAEGHPWAFAIGIRNPYRFSIDPVTGEVWIADVGQACVEEISVLDPAVDAGANLGWPVFEGDRHFLGELEAPHHAPLFDYSRAGNGFCAVVGGEIYRGTALDGLDGTYLFTDYCRGELVALDRDGGDAVLTGVEVPTPLDIAAAPDGELYVVSMTGEIHALVPAD